MNTVGPQASDPKPSDDPRCTMCGLDNRNDTHGALERTGYLGHTFTVKPRAPENTPSRVQLAAIRHRQEPSVETADREDDELPWITHPDAWWVWNGDPACPAPLYPVPSSVIGKESPEGWERVAVIPWGLVTEAHRCKLAGDFIGFENALHAILDAADGPRP